MFFRGMRKRQHLELFGVHIGSPSDQIPVHVLRAAQEAMMVGGRETLSFSYPEGPGSPPSKIVVKLQWAPHQGPAWFALGERPRFLALLELARVFNSRASKYIQSNAKLMAASLSVGRVSQAIIALAQPVQDLHGTSERCSAKGA